MKKIPVPDKPLDALRKGAGRDVEIVIGTNGVTGAPGGAPGTTPNAGGAGAGEMAGLLDLLARASTRPRYAFMVLSLIAEAADRLPAADWLDDLTRLGPRLASVAGGFDQWRREGLPEMAGADEDADFLERYSRHLRLPQVGLEGQRRLAASRVLMVGAGGLGSPAFAAQATHHSHQGCHDRTTGAQPLRPPITSRKAPMAMAPRPAHTGTLTVSSCLTESSIGPSFTASDSLV